MKIYKIFLRPNTAFGTPLVGDTFFGRLCWEFVYDPGLLNRPFEILVKEYNAKPFLIVSSAFPVCKGEVFLKRPSLPLHFLFKVSEDKLIEERKELEKRTFFELSEYRKPLNEINYQSEPFKIEDEQVRCAPESATSPSSAPPAFMIEDEQVRCSISRITWKTEEAPFGPYVISRFWYLTDLVIFVGVDEEINFEGIYRAIERVGILGYGKDASLGLGRFNVLRYEEFDPYEGVSKFNAYYTLGPSLPESSKTYLKIYYEPLVRFGRHGDIFSASPNPFKAPVLMADTGAVYIPETPEKRVYLGKATLRVSSLKNETLTQTYSLLLPVEVSHEALSKKTL